MTRYEDIAMNCPEREILQDLADGELPEAQVVEVAKHIRSCVRCKNELREILTVHRALSEIVSEDICPVIDTLEACAHGTLSPEDSTKIKQHVATCSRCRSYLWAFQASQADLEVWQTQEQTAFEQYRTRNLGYAAAKETLGKLLPGASGLFDQLWQSVVVLVTDLRNKAAGLPTFADYAHLAGTLGFAEASPEVAATSIILATTVYVAQGLSKGEIQPLSKDIEEAVRDAADQFGAGRELQSRLLETLPSLLIKVC
jgi:hypothetical protein